MKLDKLFETIHMAINKTNNLFIEWTGGEGLDAYGVEGFMVAQIASAIMDKKNKDRPGFCTLETPFSILYDCSKKPIGNKGAAGRNSNRIDIALYHKTDMLLSHVIEVKRTWNAALCTKDMDRLCTLYKKCGRVSGGPLKQAIFVQLLAISIKRNQENIEKRFKTLKEKCEEYISTKGFDCCISQGTKYCEPILNEDHTKAFSSLCLSISR